MTFPGRVYDGDGSSLQPGVPDVTQDDLDAYPHRSAVGNWPDDACDGGEIGPDLIGQVWVLDDDADYEAVPLVWRADALGLIAAGKGIVLLARRAEPEVSVREGLLDAMERFEADPEGSA